MKDHQARIEKLRKEPAASRSIGQLATIRLKHESFAALPVHLDQQSIRQTESRNDSVPTGFECGKPAILLIHSRAFFRDCFARCLQTAYDGHVIFSFESVGGWLRSGEAAALSPSFAIVVIESGDPSDSAELELLHDAPEKVPVIVVSDIEDAAQIIQTVKRGARGYIPTNLPLSVVVDAVRLVEAGGVFVPASSFVYPDQPSVSLNSGVTVTKRQREVIEEIRRGKANKQIAYELNMSEHTVKLHLRHIMRRLRARNRTQIAMFDGDLVTSSRS